MENIAGRNHFQTPRDPRGFTGTTYAGRTWLNVRFTVREWQAANVATNMQTASRAIAMQTAAQPTQLTAVQKDTQTPHHIQHNVAIRLNINSHAVYRGTIHK